MNGAPGYPAALKFEIGIPQIIALKFADGKPCLNAKTDTLMFTTTANERFFVDPYVGDRIRALRIQPGVPFQMEKVETIAGNRRIVEMVVRNLGTNAPCIAPAPSVRPQTPSSLPPPVLPTPPQLPQLPQTHMNGAGETSAVIMARCYRAAVDVAVDAVAYAQERGIRITPEFADVRALAATMAINEQGGRR